MPYNLRSTNFIFCRESIVSSYRKWISDKLLSLRQVDRWTHGIINTDVSDHVIKIRCRGRGSDIVLPWICGNLHLSMQFPFYQTVQWIRNNGQWRRHKMDSDLRYKIIFFFCSGFYHKYSCETMSKWFESLKVVLACQLLVVKPAITEATFVQSTRIVQASLTLSL